MSKLSLLFKDRILSIHELDQQQKYIIGHDPHCHIQIDSLAVNAEHASVSYINEHFCIEPNSKDAEVFINETPVSDQTRLEDGDKINLGKHTLVFSFIEENNIATPEAQELPSQRSAWVQFLNGTDMGKTMPINKSMVNINHQDEYVALISNRSDGFYLSHLKGATTPQVNEKDIGDQSINLKDQSRINIGPLELKFYLD